MFNQSLGDKQKLDLLPWFQKCLVCLAEVSIFISTQISKSEVEFVTAILGVVAGRQDPWPDSPLSAPHSII